MPHGTEDLTVTEMYDHAVLLAGGNPDNRVFLQLPKVSEAHFQQQDFVRYVGSNVFSSSIGRVFLRNGGWVHFIVGEDDIRGWRGCLFKAIPMTSERGYRWRQVLNWSGAVSSVPPPPTRYDRKFPI